MPTAHSPSKKSMLLLSRLLLSSKPYPASTNRAGVLDSEIANISKQDFDQLVALANSNHVIVRGMDIFAAMMEARGDQVRTQWAAEARAAELARIQNAIPFLHSICAAREQEGHEATVIKSLDHWPDLGSDLDLYTNADPTNVADLMGRQFRATLASRSWGDRLAHKWNFRIPGLSRLVEIHVGCLGQTGEQDALPAHLEETSVMRDAGPFRFRVPAPEEQVALATLQRMYRHFYIRLTDLVNLTGLVRAGRLDFTRLRTSAERWSIWPGVATLLKITSDYNERTGAGPLQLPEFVVRSARFGAEVTYVGEQFLRVPMLPQGSQLFLQQLIGTGAALRFRAAARLSLLPALAAAAFVNLRLTGDDKGIW